MTELLTPWYKPAILVGGCLFLLFSSGIAISFIFKRVGETDVMKKMDKEARDTGFIIGKCENLLIFLFVFFNEYTALALIFAAKAIVRREDMSKNSLYFLAGTMINVTYSVLIAIAAKVVVEHV